MKPFSCSVCGKTFSDSSNMAKHKKTHNSNAAANKETVVGVLGDLQQRPPKEAVEEGTPASSEDVQQIIYISYEEADSATSEQAEMMEQKLVRRVKYRYVEWWKS